MIPELRFTFGRPLETSEIDEGRLSDLMSVAEPDLLIARPLRHTDGHHRMLEFDIILARG